MAKSCNNCGTDKKPSTVPYAVLEDFKNASTTTIKRLWILILILVFLLVGTNAAWLWYESQFEDVVTTEEIVVDAENDGVANYIGQDGNIYNGESIGNEDN